MQDHDETVPVANPSVVLREEFDDWAILFDPDTGDAFGINPVGVFIWKRLDGLRSTQDILKELRKDYEDVSEEAELQLEEFIQEIVEKGFAGHKAQEVECTHERDENTEVS
jgi:SynChlorMet cassette protein ScmD